MEGCGCAGALQEPEHRFDEEEEERPRAKRSTTRPPSTGAAADVYLRTRKSKSGGAAVRACETPESYGAHGCTHAAMPAGFVAPPTCSGCENGCGLRISWDEDELFTLFGDRRLCRSCFHRYSRQNPLTTLASVRDFAERVREDLIADYLREMADLEDEDDRMSEALDAQRDDDE